MMVAEETILVKVGEESGRKVHKDISKTPPDDEHFTLKAFFTILSYRLNTYRHNLMDRSGFLLT